MYNYQHFFVLLTIVMFKTFKQFPVDVAYSNVLIKKKRKLASKAICADCYNTKDSQCCHIFTGKC